MSTNQNIVFLTGSEPLRYNTYMINSENPLLITIPHDILSENGKKAAKKNKLKGKAYFSELGKRSAAKRKKDKKFGKRWYKWFSKKGSEAALKAKKGKKDPIDSRTPLRPITNFLTKGTIDSD